ncbi:hypothetical protein [Rhizobium sp. Leaf391]|uniref:hypothetical protein n=1 Tax=Rhizobium sp. Leaf391 TaxID=1736360 RepID=UPI000A80AF8D|nr:hypothetical protein [Rhizobium sp. Leaf391]
MTNRITNCYISAPPGANLASIRSALTENGINILIPDDFPQSADVATHTVSLIEQADLVIGVLTSERRSQWVLVELGMAIGLKKQAILIAPPKSTVPLPLQGVLILRIPLNNKEALSFTLEQLLAAPAPTKKSSPSPVQQTSGLGQRASFYLEQANRHINDREYAAVERVVADALRESGLEALSESKHNDHRFDIAVWSDELQPFVGNPLLIEVRGQWRDAEREKSMLRSFQLHSLAAGAQWGLLIHGGSEIPQKSLTAVAPTILTISLDMLFKKLENRSFARIVTELRHDRAHNRGRDASN